MLEYFELLIRLFVVITARKYTGKIAYLVRFLYKLFF